MGIKKMKIVRISMMQYNIKEELYLPSYLPLRRNDSNDPRYAPLVFLLSRGSLGSDSKKLLLFYVKGIYNF